MGSIGEGMIRVTVPSFKSIETELEELVKDETDDLVTKIFTKVVDYSPVLRGHFRASWRAKQGGVDTSFIREGGTEESPLPPPSVPNIATGNDLLSVTISNSSPYAELIENGYSKKAPAGVLDVALNDLGLL